MGKKRVAPPPPTLRAIADELEISAIHLARIACHAKTAEDLYLGYATTDTKEERDWLRETLHQRIAADARKLETALNRLSGAVKLKAQSLEPPAAKAVA